MRATESGPANGGHTFRGGLAPRGERGFALVGALMLLLILFALTVAVASLRVSTARAADSREAAQDEYWKARSHAAEVEAGVRFALPQQYEADLKAAKAFAGGRKLPAFENKGAAPRPVYNVSTGAATGDPNPTSLLGDLAAYAGVRQAVAAQYASQFFQTADQQQQTVRVAALDEAERRTGGNGESAYTLQYVIDARVDENAVTKGRVRPMGFVTLGAAYPGCDTSARVTGVGRPSAPQPADPNSVYRGQPVTITVTYASATSVTVTGSTSGVVDLAAQGVTIGESINPQTFTVTVTPAQSENFTVTAAGRNTCSSTAPAVPVTVIQPYNDSAFVSQSVPALMQNDTVYAVTVTMRNTGTTDWTAGRNYYLVSQAPGFWGVTRVTVPTTVRGFVSGGGTGDTVTFTFNVRSPASCPVNPVFQWRMYGEDGTNPGQFGAITPPATPTIKCPDPCPVVNALTPNPPSVPLGTNVRIDWNVTGGGSGRINGVDIVPWTNVGSYTYTPPQSPGTYPVTLQVTNPDGGCSDSRTVNVTVLPRPVMTLAVDQTRVTIGTPVRLNWTSADASSVAINPSVGSNLPLNGQATIATPAVGRFTYTGVASGPGGDSAPVSATYEVVNFPCPTVTISSGGATTVRVPAGSPVRLDYSSTGAGSLFIDQGVGTVGAPSGSVVVNPGIPFGTKRYTITATAPDGVCSVQGFVDVVVDEACPGAPAVWLDQGSFTVGGQTGLHWRSSGAASTSVTMNGSPVSSSPDGDIVVGAGLAPGVYDFVITTNNNTNTCQQQATARLVVNSLVCQAAASLTPSTNRVQIGGAFDLTWGSANADQFSGGGFTPSPGAGGSVNIRPAAPGTYTYTYTAADSRIPGCAATATASVIVDACPAPVVAGFTATPNSVTKGGNQMIRLAWSVSDPSGTGVTVTIPGVGTFAGADGFVDIPQPQSDTTYFLTPTSGCGATGGTAQAQVFTSCPTPSVASFSASPNSVTQGGNQTIRLSWSVNDPSGTGVTVTIAGVGAFNGASGFVDIPQPQSDTTYTLTPANGCGASGAPASAAVTVQRPLPATCDQQLSFYINDLAITHDTYYLSKTVDFNWGGVPVQATVDQVTVNYQLPAIPVWINSYMMCYQITTSSGNPSQLQMLYSMMPGPFYPGGDTDPLVFDAWSHPTDSRVDFVGTPGLGVYRSPAPWDNANGIFVISQTYGIRGRVGGQEYMKAFDIDLTGLFLPFSAKDPLVNGVVYRGAGSRGDVMCRIIGGQPVCP